MLHTTVIMSSLMQWLRSMVRPRTSNAATEDIMEGIPENLQEHLNVIINAVGHVRKSNNVLSQTSVSGMMLVKEISNNSALDQEKIGDLMAERTDFCKMVVYCWSKKDLLEMFEKGSEDLGKQAEVAFEFYRALTGTCWNYTDESDAFCQQLDGQCGIKLMIDWLMSLQGKGKMNKWVTEIVFNVLNVLHNACRRVEDIPRVNRRVVPFLEKLAESEDPVTQACAFLTLSYLVKKDEADKLSANDACLEKLLSLLTESLEYLEHKIKITRKSSTDAIRRTFTLSSDELVQGIEQLAINDDNKRSIVEKGGISVLGRMLEMDCTPEEKTHAAEGLWQLAFLPQNREKLRQQPDIIRELINLSGSDKPSLRSACMGALFEIYDSKLPEEVTKPKDTGPTGPDRKPFGIEKPSSRVMISYRWEHPSKDVMREIKDQLRERGYKVWMDEEQMSGCMIEAMASAVENADVIVACITQGYQDSKNCRTEATYAYDCNKKIIPVKVSGAFRPSGWLGGITAGKIYYVIPEVDAVSEELPRIVDLEIEKDDDFKKAQPNAAEAPTPTPSHQPSTPGVCTWDVDEVHEWLAANNISSSNECLQQFNGVQLVQLKKQLATAPESFYQGMKEDLKVSYMDVLSLAAALEKL